jgi:hypothetical protein
MRPFYKLRCGRCHTSLATRLSTDVPICHLDCVGPETNYGWGIFVPEWSVCVCVCVAAGGRREEARVGRGV